MHIRLPWILSRRRLIISAAIDGLLFIVVYYSLFKWKFDSWPVISLRLSLLLIIWLLFSYVTGRYVSGNTNYQLVTGLSVIKKIGKTLLVLAFTLAITLIHLWLFNKNPVAATYRSFLLPFLCLLSAVSVYCQFIFERYLLSQEFNKKNWWLFIGSSFAHKKLQQNLRWTRLPVQLIHELPGKPVSTIHKQIVIDEASINNSDNLEYLLSLRQNGFNIITKLSWCESVLQRFPSDILVDYDIIRGEFLIPQKGFQIRFKRVGDVAFASLLLLSTTPLILISAVLIKLNDNGPVFYSQVRTGIDGKPYRLWKLRSMGVDAEQEGAQWSSKSDSRITKIGSILRRTRLDELPQLWCVIKGSMSLIGPRPERPEFDRQLEKVIPYYKLRRTIKPGLSGWAQVNYPYGASVEDSANKLSYDLYYLRNFSIWLDLLILFKTIRLVFNAKGAIPNA